jgi:xylan 1,4-beta-xylosidase
MIKIHNPILPGFNPDPSILRVGDDYYIATSTFEWFPAVQIHHSKDLVNWKLITHPITRVSQLDLTGNLPSCGIWAPCLSFCDGTYYLIYTNTRVYASNFKDCHNYLITAKDIMGPWSEPIYMNSSGFDPSLFHDTDGRKWFVNMRWDHRKGKNPFSGIVLQEYDPKQQKLVGPVKNIFTGTHFKLTEGPHLYKVNGYYYLLTAEGGTTFDHLVTMARSKNIDGPYEVDPTNPVLTSRFNPQLLLQRAGHASIVQTQNDQWYMVHLCGRPLPADTEPKLRCVLGRETAIQKCFWTDDGWLRIQGDNTPKVDVDAPGLPEYKFKPEPARDDFDTEMLNPHYAILRLPPNESWLSLKDRKGFLRLKGRESMASNHNPSLIGRRLQAMKCQITTCVEFEPDHFQQMAGLSFFYDSQNYFYLRISRDETLGKHIGIITSDNNNYDELCDEVEINNSKRVTLRGLFDYGRLQFSYSLDDKNFKLIGPVLDATRLSDEYCKQGCFTGAFAAISCQDISGTKLPADFDYFEYKEL